MRLGLVQCALEQGDTLDQLLALYRALEADLVVAPELVLTGTVIPGEDDFAARLAVVREAVRQRGVPLLLGAVEPRGPKNVALLVEPGGVRLVAEKVNLFPAFDQRVGLRPGVPCGPFGAGEALLGAVICFDLRFPELARRLVTCGARVLLVLAAWPVERVAHFHLLLRARAVENQVFVCGVNACGEAAGFRLAGESRVFDPWGEELLRLEGVSSGVVELDFARLDQTRRLFVSSRLSPPPSPEGKVVSLEEALRQAAARRRLGQRMVFTNGCFDLLHAGHVDYLFEARRQGDFLVVGLNSDASVRRLKGPGRPVNSQERRALVLAGLSAVDLVVVFEEDTPEALIRALRPEVLVKGEDWPEEKIVGADFVRSLGGRVVRVPFRHRVSTTALVEEIRSRA